ncbi:hypothetical protein BN10_140071 [Phycicoccus elongatus Lp2]|uniref:Uncharacterized protein n=1 Tax=Phycicoccus elongatus Lp2 TaxID=1193181 RepID=N0E2Z9_9MICO|nr:hypothetical protein BN10_140071 [Phycicoccus elongatus Lp2]
MTWPHGNCAAAAAQLGSGDSRATVCMDCSLDLELSDPRSVLHASMGPLGVGIALG